MEVAKEKLVVDVKLEPSAKPRWTLADALLADLETSVTPRNIYENKWETHTTTEHVTTSQPTSGATTTLDRSRRLHSPDPPPLPPLPSKEVLDSLQDSQEFFGSRSPGQPVYSSTITISKSVYKPNGDDDLLQHSPLRSDSGSLSTTDSRYETRQTRLQQLSPHSPRPTQLSNNLSELDHLLNDLSSAKFYAEVDKTSHNVLGNHSVSPQPTGTLRSQSGSRSGTLQREQEIPKLIVPAFQHKADYGNYDDLDPFHDAPVQGSFIQQQGGGSGTLQLSSTSQNQFYEVHEGVVPTNVQQPPIQQLHPDQFGSQYRGETPSPTFQMQNQQELYSQQQMQQQQQQHQVQQQLPVGSAVQVIQQPAQSQVMLQSQGQGPSLQEPLGQSHFNVQRYTEQRFVSQPSPHVVVNLPPQQHFTNQMISQQSSSQPLQQHQQQQQQFIGQASSQQAVQPIQQQQQVYVNQTVTQQGSLGGPQGRTTSASKDLEELMASFSEFDMGGGATRGEEPHYAQPVKTRQASTSFTGCVSGDATDASASRNSQERAASGYLSVSQGGHGTYDGMSPGSSSPGPHEMIIQRSPSDVGHPVPVTVFSQDQSSSKMVVTQGMHGVLPQGRSGQAGEGQLEMMLGQLGNDLNQQGILTLPKGDCAACKKPIVGQVLMALGKIWHPQHFVCVHCRQELGTNIFFERDGQPYCENDYQILFSPKCALCGGTILEKCITALNKTWHPEHFFCAQCQHPFGEEGFHERNGMPFCRDDYFRMYAPKCGGCGNAILSNYVTALQQQWHPECFVCRECHAPFDSGSFFDHNGLPYCEQHFHARRGSLCAACRQPITGRCIAAMYRKFHPEHFVCVFCLQQLNKGTFKEQNEKPYCHQCFDKLFG